MTQNKLNPHKTAALITGTRQCLSPVCSSDWHLIPLSLVTMLESILPMQPHIASLVKRFFYHRQSRSTIHRHLSADVTVKVIVSFMPGLLQLLFSDLTVASLYTHQHIQNLGLSWPHTLSNIINKILSITHSIMHLVKWVFLLTPFQSHWPAISN